MNIKKPYRRVLAILLVFLLLGLALLIADILSRQPRPAEPDSSKKTGENRESLAVPIEQVDAVLYFLAPGKRSSEPGILCEEPRPIRRGASPTDQTRVLMEELAAGSRQGNLPVIPPGTRLNQVYLLKDNRMVLNYSHALAENCPEGVEGEMALVYAIVNTLTRNIQGIPAVRILIDGRERETLGGHLDISSFIEQDLSLVRAAKPQSDLRRIRPLPPLYNFLPRKPAVSRYNAELIQEQNRWQAR